MMVIKKYFLICSPNSSAIEVEVNKILAENTGGSFQFLQPLSGLYFKRELEMTCRKCASKVVEADGQYKCSECKRTYTKDEFEKNAKTHFTQAGTLFLQPFVYEVANDGH